MKPPNRALACFVPVLALALSACSQPVPPDKSDYVGLRQSKKMSLLILQDGIVKYERLKSRTLLNTTGVCPLPRSSGLFAAKTVHLTYPHLPAKVHY